MAALDAETLDGMQQLLLHQPDHAGCRVLDRQAERLRDGFLDGLAASVAVDRHRAVGIRPGLQPTEHELGIGDGGIAPAQPVAGRARPGAGALGADMQQARRVDAGDGAAAGADRMDLDRRRGALVAVDVELIGESDVSPAISMTSQLVPPISMEIRLVEPMASRSPAARRARRRSGQQQRHRTVAQLARPRPRRRCSG